MAKGYPDYYRGMVLYGLFNDIPKEITVDASGNLAAFLKAMYGSVPTPITCDEEGNINIAIAVQNTDFRVIPATPEQNIPVKPGTGTADFPIDIKTQTLTRLNIRNSLGTYYSSSNTINPTTQTTWTVIDLAGNIFLNHLTIVINSGTVQDTGAFTVIIDGVSWAAMSFTEYRDFQANGRTGSPLICTCYDDVNYIFKFALAQPIYCNSSFKILWAGRALNNGSLQSKFGYYKV